MQEIAKTTVVYTLTLEDLTAFNLFSFRNSSTIRAMQRRSLISASLTTFFFALGVSLLMRLPFWASLWYPIACMVGTAAYFRRYHKHGYIKRLGKLVERTYSENKQPGLLGDHTLEVDAEGITHVNPYSRAQYAWGALERIETEPGYTYLYLGAQTFIIRHEAIVSGDFKAFLEKISQHHQPGRTIAR